MSRNHLQDRLQNKSSKKAEGVKRRDLLLGTTSLVAASAISAAAVPRATNAATPEVLPEPEAAFKGKISQTLKDSTPDFPKGVEAPAGAPNVLLILTDDVGFGASSTFGGPIQTPNFQRLADSGLRYTKYHTTALCSPTRAALITGRNHHSVASGSITEFATGYPGYNSLVPKSAGSVGAVLKDNGYNNVMVRQNAQCAGLDVEPGRPVRSVANRSRLRIFLRVSRGRQRPMAPGAV